jgi:hypothetical protein
MNLNIDGVLRVVHTRHVVSPMSDNWIPLDIVDDDVGNSFAHMDNAKKIEKKWEKYREVLWPKERKGKLFLQTTAEREILCKILESPEFGTTETTPETQSPSICSP